MSKTRKLAVYFVLWIAALIVAGTIIVMWDTSEDVDNIFDNNLIQSAKKNSSLNIVNDLLLSARELNIARNPTLIDFKNKAEASDPLIISNQDVRGNPDNLYHSILQKKLERIKKKSAGEDFYIRPVPK